MKIPIDDDKKADIVTFASLWIKYFTMFIGIAVLAVGIVFVIFYIGSLIGGTLGFFFVMAVGGAAIITTIVTGAQFEDYKIKKRAQDKNDFKDYLRGVGRDSLDL